MTNIYIYIYYCLLLCILLSNSMLASAYLSKYSIELLLFLNGFLCYFTLHILDLHGNNGCLRANTDQNSETF